MAPAPQAGLLPQGELQHLISDAATMQIIRWTGGGFGMAAHNYDGDMLTDEVAQVISINKEPVVLVFVCGSNSPLVCSRIGGLPFRTPS
jgi:hypothetical protein